AGRDRVLRGPPCDRASIHVAFSRFRQPDPLRDHSRRQLRGNDFVHRQHRGHPAVQCPRPVPTLARVRHRHPPDSLTLMLHRYNSPTRIVAMKTTALPFLSPASATWRPLRMFCRAALWLAAAVAAITASAQWTPTNSPPDRLSYQGYLADANGNPLAPITPVNYPIVFRIWSAANGGARQWSEQQTVTVDKGNFSVVLGEGTQYLSEARPSLSSILASKADASDRYVEITVTINSAPVVILPRLR